ncbi:hypothetical protein BJ508DRAFT_306361 [Ascobolus immersus RN42]|uniref:Uncharacterized protein n=1 Tax=Ascobolus immersus RN42 TaxID=1160509 RepID=A0A3N4I8G2_ASCIM|nr:hypothetical protein BJ508DRAFT_306361 [Ascobolus immersus RN42]
MPKYTDPLRYRILCCQRPSPHSHPFLVELLSGAHAIYYSNIFLVPIFRLRTATGKPTFEELLSPHSTTQFYLDIQYELPPKQNCIEKLLFWRDIHKERKQFERGDYIPSGVYYGEAIERLWGIDARPMERNGSKAWPLLHERYNLSCDACSVSIKDRVQLESNNTTGQEEKPHSQNICWFDALRVMHIEEHLRKQMMFSETFNFSLLRVKNVPNAWTEKELRQRGGSEWWNYKIFRFLGLIPFEWGLTGYRVRDSHLVDMEMRIAIASMLGLVQ